MERQNEDHPGGHLRPGWKEDLKRRQKVRRQQRLRVYRSVLNVLLRKADEAIRESRRLRADL